MKTRIQFNYPETLSNPQPKYISLLQTLFDKIGREQLEMRIESITTDWAMKSGYQVEFNENLFLFTHVSLL